MIKCQICLLANYLNVIGGIETFVYNWCNLMKDTYDIVVAVTFIADEQYYRLKKIVKVVENTADIECDTVIVMHIGTKFIPDNIKYNKKIQMLHGCKSIAYSNIQKCDLLIPVSETARKSFGNELNQFNTDVILNPMYLTKPKRVLKLISATRLTSEKGGCRILKLAEKLRKSNIPFIWYVFSNKALSNKKHKKDFNGIVEMPSTLDISSWIKECDYLVQLSDSESFGYSIVESLMLGTPVIVTPLDVLNEIGFKEGVNGFTIPFDMEDIDIDKIYNSKLKFEYSYDNQVIANKWRDVLGKPQPFVKYKYKEVTMKIKAINNYFDTQLDAKKYPKYPGKDYNRKAGDIYEVSEERARVIIAAKHAVEIVEPKEETLEEPAKELKAKEVEVETATIKEPKVEKAVVKKTTTKKVTTRKSK